MPTDHETRVVHCRRSSYDIYIGRPSKWGNPYEIGKHGDREQVIGLYRTWLWHQIQAGDITTRDLAELDGKTLGCWCSPKPCHGDVLAKAAAWARVDIAEWRAAIDEPCPTYGG